VKTLQARLRFAREHAGLSQGQVAKLLRKHRPTISEIEAGRRRVSSDELAAFARMYDVSIGWLTGEEQSSEFDDRVLIAARQLAKLKSNDLDGILRLIKSMRRTK
jgi:transcriptional regulator with XRE-family HTH domain